MKRKTGIAAFLLEHAGKNPVSFHMPGHKGEAFYRDNGCGDFLDVLMDCDITEIPGADNLFQTEGIIRQTMDRYRALYNTEESYLLINGSSAGLIASIMTAVKRGGSLIMARNCHKSIFNGVVMAGAEPVYAYPEMLDSYGISGQITAEEIRRCLKEHPDSDAVILPSPNYYGICSDIRAIAEAVHEAGKILIVDQAHGAHLKFFDRYIREEDGLPLLAAENLGADIVINSIHKTLGAFTQTAVVNLCSERIDKYDFEDKLQLIESTSPSYLLMASADLNAEILEKRGRSLIGAWEDNLQYFYGEAEKIPGLRVMADFMLDHTKINLDMSRCGFTGLELEEQLMKYQIYPELVTGNIVMCMTGIGNRRCDYERLLQALTELSTVGNSSQQKMPEAVQSLTVKKLVQCPIPTERERIPLEKAAGRICAGSIIPYPPGIPIICPGEIIDGEVLRYTAELRKKGEKVMGIDDLGRVTVGKE